jgi:hypothetical protein
MQALTPIRFRQHGFNLAIEFFNPITHLTHMSDEVDLAFT